MLALEGPLVRKVLAWTNVFLYTIVLYNGYCFDSQTARKHDTAIEPDGPYFAIWGLIYLLLACYVIREACFTIPDDAPDKNSRTGQVRLLFGLSCLLNSAFVQCMSKEWFLISFFCMFSLWLVLGNIYVYNIERFRPVYEYSPFSLYRDWKYASEDPYDYLFRRIPFSIYYGWTCVATILVVVVYLGSLGYPAMLWPSLAIVSVGALAYLMVSFVLCDFFIGLVGAYLLFACMKRCERRMFMYDEYVKDVAAYEDAVRHHQGVLPPKPELTDMFAPISKDLFAITLEGFLVVALGLLTILALSLFIRRVKS